MLVLTRTKNQQIVINGDVVVTVLDVKGDRVRLGILAPEAVPVDRKELHDRREAWLELARQRSEGIDPRGQSLTPGLEGVS